MKRVSLAAVILITMLAASAHAGTIDIPATGQTKCYDSDGATGEIPCAGTGQDGETLMGAAWPNPRFVTNADTTVTDRLTGLTWAPKGDGTDDGSCGGGYNTWDDLLTYVDCLNTNNYLGHNDWRLSNVRELRSLMSPGYSEMTAACGGACASIAAWLNNVGFTEVKESYYWPSTSVPKSGGNENTAFQPSMADGYGMGTSFKTNSHYAFPVRGTATPGSGLAKTGKTACFANDGTSRDCTDTGEDGELQEGIAWPSPRFTDNGDDTITDNLTGLMWMQDTNCMATAYSGYDADGSVIWQSALTFIAGINAGTYPNCRFGYTDWRMPNLGELYSLVDFGNYEILPSGHPFDNIPPGGVWTSTTFVNDTTHEATLAFTTSFTDGSVGINDKDTAERRMWAVRGGLDNTGAPEIDPSAMTIDFGEVTINTTLDKTFDMSNTGTQYLYFNEVANADGLTAPFSIVDDTCTNRGVGPSSTCSVTVRFSPTAEGDYDDTFDVPSNDADESTLTLTVLGTGTVEEVTPTNTQPTAGQLVYPTDGMTGLGTSVTFIWKKSTDADGETLSYDFTYCTDPNLNGCDAIEGVAAKASPSPTINLAALAKDWLKSLVAGPFALMGCGGSNATTDATITPPTPGEDELSYTVTGLESATTYYWKVTTNDASGGSADSQTMSFTTE